MDRFPNNSGKGYIPAEPVKATLRISASTVSLIIGDENVTQRPAGLSRSTLETAREEARRRTHPRPGADPSENDAMLGEVGNRLANDFLAGSVGVALASQIADVQGLNGLLELGLVIAEPELDDLPWETLQLPQRSAGVSDAVSSPLALHPHVALYRQMHVVRSLSARKIRGPLRLLVVIASPEMAQADLLDYEAELARIMDAVDSARERAETHVQVLNEGSLGSIAAALREDPDGFHVLHLSCHARPGELILESADGQPDFVSAERLIDEGIAEAAVPPMVVLAGCSTGLTARQRRLGSDAMARYVDHQSQDGDRGGEFELASFATRLIRAGVPQVIAMQAPVSDRYAAQLTAKLYHRLASGESPDPLLAFTAARQEAEKERIALAPDSPRRGPAEWATPALFAGSLRSPLFSRDEPFGALYPRQVPELAEGVVVREVGEFVGRRLEARKIRGALAQTNGGLVVHGIGGVGKSSLAAEVIRSLGRDSWLVVSKAGPLSADVLLREAGIRLHRAVSQSRDSNREQLVRAALRLQATDVEPADRWRSLSAQVLPITPMIVLLDNFEDNLQKDSDGWAVADPELADLIASWVTSPGLSHFIITSRHSFALPRNAAQQLSVLHLGPLSAAESRKLIWRLPGLDALSLPDKERAYRDVGGHPRTLEYLDALLRGGQARFGDITKRLESQLSARDISNPHAWLAQAGHDINTGLAEAISIAAADIVLPDLLLQLPRIARELLLHVAVYRIPIDNAGLIFALDLQEEWLARIAAGQQVDFDLPASLTNAVLACQAAGLLTCMPQPGGSVFYLVHRWTAAAIATFYPDSVAEAHQRAAEFWKWRVEYFRESQSASASIDQLLEARYHYYTAGQTNQAVITTAFALWHLNHWGQYNRAAQLGNETIEWLPPISSEAASMRAQLGIYAQNGGDYVTAERSIRQALEIFEEIGDESEMGKCHGQLGILAGLVGDHAAAERYFRRALEVFERVNDQEGAANIYHQLGERANARGDYAESERLLRRSLEIEENREDPMGAVQAGTAPTYAALGSLAQNRGDYAAAERFYNRALQISRRFGDMAGIAYGCMQLGDLAELQEDNDTAERFHRKAAETFESIGDQQGMAKSYVHLGILTGSRGDFDTAERFYQQATEIADRIGDLQITGNSCERLGDIACQRGDYDAARLFYSRALQIFERLGDQRGIANCYSGLGALSEALGQPTASVCSRALALFIRLQIGAPRGAAGNLQALHRLYAELGPKRFKGSLPPQLDSDWVDELLMTLKEMSETHGN